MKTQIVLVVKNNTPIQAHEIVLPYRMEDNVREIIKKSKDYKEVKSIRTAYRVQRRHESICEQSEHFKEFGDIYVGRRLNVSNLFYGFPFQEYFDAWNFVSKHQENPKVMRLPNFEKMNEIVSFMHDVKFR